jgi:hypothetical protein
MPGRGNGKKKKGTKKMAKVTKKIKKSARRG